MNAEKLARAIWVDARSGAPDSPARRQLRRELSVAAYHYQADTTGGAMSEEERERLILEHLPQVRLVARKIHESLPESVCFDDLLSAGVVGLIQAIDNFDPAQNVKLKTYAEFRIRGAILDSLRETDWAPRLKRKQAREFEAAIARLEQRLGADRKRRRSPQKRTSRSMNTVRSSRKWKG